MADFSYKEFSGAMASNINHSLAPKNVVELLYNLDADYEIGSLSSRLGTGQIGAQLVDNVGCLGIVQHVDQADTTKNKLFAVFNDGASPTNSDIYDVAAGTKSLQDDTASLKTYFLNYNGDTLRLNGTDAPKAFNSTSWITTGGVFDLANMPTGYKYPKEFLDRVYLWGHATTPYTLKYSTILESGAITWTTGDAGDVEIEPEDGGGEATGLGKVPGYLLIFKRRSMKRWNFSSAFPESLVNIGAYSQESIVEGGGLCAFYSDSHEDAKGFYVTNGGRPIPISHDNTRPIKKWVDAISATAVVSGWATERVFAWSVGDLTVDGIDYVNVVLRYNHKLNQWSVRSYPNELRHFASYVASGVNSIVAGDDDGNVWQVDKINTYADGTTPIEWRLATIHDNFGTNKLKKISDRIVLSGENIEGSVISVIPNRTPEEEVVLGGSNIFRKVLAWLGVERSVEGNTLSLNVKGSTNGARAVIRELELVKIDEQQSYDA